MVFSRHWMETDGASAHFPSLPEVLGVLTNLPFNVPARGHGRQTWHRERYCIVALLKFFAKCRPDIFPATLIRQESPDFLMKKDYASPCISIEHTDLGSSEYQKFLAQEAKRGVTGWATIGDTDGWVGDGPERIWRHDLATAISKKTNPKCWQRSPKSAERLILAYDQSEANILVSDEAIYKILCDTLQSDAADRGQISAVAVVRGQDQVVFAERGT